jgi:hypothetical protein
MTHIKFFTDTPNSTDLLGVEEGSQWLRKRVRWVREPDLFQLDQPTEFVSLPLIATLRRVPLLHFRRISHIFHLLRSVMKLLTARRLL